MLCKSIMEYQNNQQKNYGYDKRPLWQWILLYVIIGALVYGAVYFLFFNNRGYDSSAPENNYPVTIDTNNNQVSANNYMIQNMNVEILAQGVGAEAKKGDLVTVNYTGKLVDGTVFDSSLKPGREPFQFRLGENKVIQGWELGVLGMKVGEKRKLTIPPELGYGSSGYPPVIPPNAKLVFDIEFLSVKTATNSMNSAEGSVCTGNNQCPSGYICIRHVDKMTNKYGGVLGTPENPGVCVLAD